MVDTSDPGEVTGTSTGVTKLDRRPDGRTEQTALRSMTCELSSLSHAHGSATWKAGSTHVLAAVSQIAPKNPQQADGSSNNDDVCVVSVILKSANLNVALETEWENVLAQTIRACLARPAHASHQRPVLQIVIHVLGDDGSVLGACLHASVAAVLDAGIELRRLPVAVTCLVVAAATAATQHDSNADNNSTVVLLLDPCRDEEEVPNNGVLTMVLDATSRDEHVLAMHSQSVVANMATILEANRLATRAASAVLAFWRLAVEQKSRNEGQTLWSS